ncbi:MAG: hypothetical protein ABIE25_04195 [Thermoplasmatota archaeon]|nr:hypothetical protein [Candidatus Thermoplasmatota archaeon]MBU1914032.1 hypothetical protein [Candidatus Thermoplasmatota archaeon]
MRLVLATSTALVSALLICTSLASAEFPTNPGSPKYANSILSGFITPVVSPGTTVDFSFNFTNPYYDNDSPEVMIDFTLVVGIYRYSTQEKTENVTSTFPHPPLIRGDSIQLSIFLPRIGANTTTRVDLPIETSRKTPHGSYFSQSTYFVRFNLTFSSPTGTQVVLKSRGFFTDEQWNTAVSFSSGDPIVNTTYLKSIGVDGLLPDSSFGIKIPIPRWPLAVLVGSIGGLSFAALYFYVLDNPGRYPKLEQRFYYLRGKLRELRDKSEDR